MPGLMGGDSVLDYNSHGKTINNHFIAYSEEFYDVVGSDPQFYTVIDTDAHEGPVYVADENALYFTTVPKSSNIPVALSNEE